MTATDELRRLLDERGIEWWEECGFTYWKNRFGYSCNCATGHESGMVSVLFDAKPEQAVEATLGRGECHDLAETPEYRDKTEFKCSECGYEYSAVGGFGCDCGDAPDFCFCPNCGRAVRA